MADADADRAIFVVDADRNDRSFEARVAHPRHGEEQLARKKARCIHLRSTMDCAIGADKALRLVQDGLETVPCGPYLRTIIHQE